MNNNDIQQTSIFDLLPEEERKDFLPSAKVENEKQSSKAAARTKTAAPSKPAEEAEPDEYEIDRVVFYAGHRMEVPSRTMKLEEVRAMLEDTFPELTKERTDMTYDKTNGHIVPVLKAHKKGATTLAVYTEPPEAPVPPLYYLLDRDGHVHEVRTTQTGTFTAMVCSGVGLRSTFTLSVPRIPVWVLSEIVERFKVEPDVEHLAYIVFDSEEGYSVHWPEQRASSVTVEGSGFMETETRFVVGHIHSHGRLHAFWSSTDNADEIRTGLYGVVGEVDKVRPTLAFRYSCGGKFKKVNPVDENIFDGQISEMVMPI